MLPLTDPEVRALREDFPLLTNSPSVYLDSGATSQKPLAVLDAERDFYLHRNAAVHRGAHTLAVEATDAYEEARRVVAGFVGGTERELVWTSNATEAINLITYSFSNASAGRGGGTAARFRLGPGDEIVTTEAEHHANLIPWQELAARTGATLRHIPVTDDGMLDLDAVPALITERTRVVAITHVSNVTGFVTPLARIVPLARAVGALVVLDACQAAPHLALHPRELDVDVAVFSGHKLYGPTGIGVLYGRAAVLDALPPHLFGGSAITTVTLDKAHFLPAPQRFEPGTPRIAQALGLAEAVRFVTEIGLDRIAATEHVLAERLHAALAAIPGIRVLGGSAVPAGQRVALASVVVDDVHAHDAGQVLDDQGIAVRVGHHCAQPLHRRLGATASVRLSAGVHTTADELDRAVEAVAGIRAYFGLEADADTAGKDAS